MTMFKGIETTKPTAGGNYDRAGHYVYVIDHMKTGQSGRTKADFFAIEKTCLHCIAPGKDVNGADVAPHSPGEEVTTILTNAGPAATMFLPNLKGIFVNLMELEPGEQASIDEAFCEAVIGPSQPFAGVVVEVMAREITTKGAGKPYTRVSFQRIVTNADLAKFGIEKTPTMRTREDMVALGMLTA